MGKVMTLSLKETLTLTLTHNPNPYLSFFGAQSTLSQERLADLRHNEERNGAQRHLCFLLIIL